MRLRHSARTDVGQKRDHNEDDFGVGEGAQITELGGVFIVADGMGGHAAGEVASRLLLRQCFPAITPIHLRLRENALQQAFERANERIYVEGHGNMEPLALLRFSSVTRYGLQMLAIVVLICSAGMESNK